MKNNQKIFANIGLVIAIVAVVEISVYAAMTKKEGLTLAQIKNSEIIFGDNMVVTLKDGGYSSPDCKMTPRGDNCEGIEAFGDELYTGDLDGDGKLDAAAIMHGYCGGAGVCYTSLGVWLNENDKPKFVDSIKIGYRAGVKSVVLSKGEVSFEANLHDINDEDQSFTKFNYKLFGSKFVEIQENQTQLSTCEDSDGGLNYYLEGQASIPVDGPGHNPQFFDDECQGNTLIEGYCSENGRVASKEYACPNGCSRGACVQSKNSTVDWKTYTNTKYGYSFDYPADHTLSSAIYDGKIREAGGTDSDVAFSLDEKKAGCCDIASISIVADRELVDWKSNNIQKNYLFSDPRAVHYKIDGYEAVEILGSESNGESYKTIAIAVNGNRGVIITQASENSLLDQIISTFKFTK